MEDRLTPGLWLEITEATPADYRDLRLAEVGSHPGVERASVWADERPGRDDLPRSLDGVSTLGLYEVGADFVHLRHIAEAAVPGYTMITPYERAGGTGPRFLHLYEMDTDDPEPAFQSMTPLVAERLGDGSDAFRRWAMTPELHIDFVSTFRRTHPEQPVG